MTIAIGCPSGLPADGEPLRQTCGPIVTEPSTIIRIAAKGDGVTADGRHVPGTVPGDLVNDDGTITPGPHRAVPPCRHFPRCGACQLQHADEAALTRFVADRVVGAAAPLGVAEEAVALPAMSPPRTRRRASLKVINGGGRPAIGFTQAGSHKVVDMQECHVLHPDLFAILAPLRGYLASSRGRYAIGVQLTLCDQGVDVNLTGFVPEGLDATESLLDLCRREGFARLTVDAGYGPEGFWEPAPLTVTLGGVPVTLPPGPFLQATAHGEAVLTGAVSEWLRDCEAVADLFSGLGTFAFALPSSVRILAAEADKAAHDACRLAAAHHRRNVTASHRDLFRNPLRAEELRGYDGTVLDPPRAGARTQIAQIAESGVAKVAYVSCNPVSWARDCAALKDAGYRLADLRPVGQFRWSTHVELASLFVKEG